MAAGHGPGGQRSGKILLKHGVKPESEPPTGVAGGAALPRRPRPATRPAPLPVQRHRQAAEQRVPVPKPLLPDWRKTSSSNAFMKFFKCLHEIFFLLLPIF